MRKEPQHPGEDASGGPEEMWELRLFVAGSGVEVERVRGVLEGVCQEHLPGRYRIVMVDIMEDPEQADSFDIVAAPTVIRQAPLPVRRVIGDLSLVPKVVLGLGIPALQEP